MRVRFRNHIDLCKRITYSGSDLLIITTEYGHIYTVVANSKEDAEALYEKALIDGYIDVSNLEYTN